MGMRWLRSILSFLIMSQSACFGGSSAKTPAENEQVGLSMSVESSESESLVIGLDFLCQEEEAKGRMMEAFVRYSDNLKYVSSVPGDAVKDAQKNLIVQQKVGNTLRAVIFSPENVNTITSGRLANFMFAKTGSGQARLEILTEKPIFAPNEANEGLLVSEPLVINLD